MSKRFKISPVSPWRFKVTKSAIVQVAYDDWFFPSKDEVYSMYTNLHLNGIGGFTINSPYGCSSDSANGTLFWQISFTDGIDYLNRTKNEANIFRPCRSFAGNVGDYTIGQVGPAGGWIFDYQAGLYYEAASADQPTFYWSNVWSGQVGPGTAIGTGITNTASIIAQVGHTNSVAKKCNDLSINGWITNTVVNWKFKVTQLLPWRFKITEVESDSVAPTLLTAILTDNFTLTLTFSEALNESVTPDYIDFVYAQNVTDITISGAVVTLTFDTEILYSDTDQIAYIPGTNKLQDTSGNEVAAFTSNVDNTIFPDGSCTDLLLSAPTTDGFRADWINGSTDETSIIIEISTDNITFTPETLAAGTEFIIFTGLNDSQAYYVKVRAVKTTFYSVYTTTETITTETDIPDVPTGLTAVWVNDFARLTVNDIPANVQIEWWESENGGAYTLVSLTAVDIVTYDNYTWQNQSMAFKCRAKKGTTYSDYCTPVSLLTPLVFQTNQSTLTLLRFAFLNVLAANTVTINYGDGSAPSAKTGNNTNVDYNYSVQGTYYVQLLGSSNNSIQMLYCHSQLTNFGNLSKWVLNAGMTRLFLHQSSFTGTILQHKNLPSGLQYLGLYPTTGQPRFSGTFKAQTLPTAVIQYSLSGCDLSGDMSGVLINNTSTNGLFDLSGNVNITKALRGRFDNVTQFNFANNMLNTAELDSLLVDIDASLTTYAPTVSTTYTFNGAGNGIPTGGASNTNIVSIKNKYTAAGYTATIVINT
jgi:hypothetical protein